MSKEKKSIILYHRSYRKLPGSVRSFFIHYALLAAPLSALVVVFYPELTLCVSRIAVSVLSPFYAPETLKIIGAPYISIIGDVSLVWVPGRYPTILFSLLNVLACVLLLVVLPRIKQYKPLIILGIIITCVHLISSLFFLFVPQHFPYEAVDYSELYMKQQIGIWFFVPLILGIAILHLPSSLFSKCGSMLAVYFYSLVFGTIRYAIFLFVLSKISMLYMALLFFALGPLIDFVYVVGIYSMHVTRFADKIHSDFALWKW